jgi:Type II secretion system (T2SS), protein E, N-terminal domain
MREEATILPANEQRALAYKYTQASHVQDIATRIQALLTAQVEQVALVTMTLHFANNRPGCTQQSASIDQSMRYFLDMLRPLVRKTDQVLLLGTSSYFILLGSNQQGALLVQERLWDALLWRVHNIEHPAITRPSALEAGHSAYPIPYQDVQEVIEAAGRPRLSFEMPPEPSLFLDGPQSDTDNEPALPDLARKLGVPYLPQLPRQRAMKVRQIIGLELARELNCYPVGCERDILTVAMTNPQDQQILERLRQETGMRIFPVLTHPLEIQSALEELN